MKENELRHVSAESKELLELGYTIIRGGFNDEEIELLKQEINLVYDTIPTDPTIGERPEFRHRMLCYSAACQSAIAHPCIMNVITPLLGEDCHVIANTSWRQAPQAQNRNCWHCDAGPHIPLPLGVTWPSDIPHPVFVIGTHIFLEDCPLEAGPTGVIPTSHLSGRAPPSTVDMDLTFNGHGAVPLIARKGDVACFVSDVWHRRLPSEDQVGRYFLQVHYGRRDIAQRLYPTYQRNHINEEVIGRAEESGKTTIVGLHDIYFYDS
jgi:hypothetical protein